MDILSAFLTGREHYDSVNKSEESVVLTHTDIQTGMVLSATLTFDNVASTAF